MFLFDSIDATIDNGRIGRYINHSREGNAKKHCQKAGEHPRLYFIANRDIKAGEEILYDYGERQAEAITNFPWLLT